MTQEEEKQLWIKILQPLAKLAVVNEFLAKHPDIEIKLKLEKSLDILQ